MMIKSYLKIALEDLKNTEMDSTDILLLSLVKSYDAKNKLFEMNQETIAKILNVSRRTINSSIKNLKELCKIISVRRYKKTSILKVTARPCNSFIKMDMDILKLGLKPNETIILTLIKNNYSVAEIKEFFAKSTVYDVLKKLQELKIISENDLCKSDIENKNEKSNDNDNDNIIDIASKITSYGRNTTNTDTTDTTDTTGYEYRKAYPQNRTNRFNNFKQRQYSKEEQEEINRLFYV